jgi:hypothetical protein
MISSNKGALDALFWQFHYATFECVSMPVRSTFANLMQINQKFETRKYKVTSKVGIRHIYSFKVIYVY